MASKGAKIGGHYPAVIKPCTCENEWQDKKYGKYKRVMNVKQSKAGGFRCTVCGKQN